jgi:hypothetical protein
MKNKPQITVLLLNYGRPENIGRILQSISAQTIPCHVFLWNNGDPLPSETEFDWHLQSTTNVGCWPRWFAAGFAETQFICSLDDDLTFARADTLSTVVSILSGLSEPDVAIGLEGVILDPRRPYYVPHQNAGFHLRSGDTPARVDIVKGRFLACRTSELLPINLSPDEREDDIAICGQLAKGRNRHHLIPAGLSDLFQELPQNGAGNFNSSEHIASREKSRRRYFSS